MARRWQVLLVTAVAVFMSFLDTTIVNIAFPDIRASFPESSLSQLSWILNAYNIVFAAALIPAGRLADRFGRRRFYFLGVFIFLAASVACGAAGSVGMLVAARGVQALGGAMLVPASLGLLLPEFPLERRATATALWGATGAVAAATGPSLGGLLVAWQGWRAVFFVNLLIGLPALLPARRLLRESREPHTAVPDALGALLLGAGVGALALGIVQGPQWGWSSPRIVGSFIASAALLAAVLRRSTRHPVPVIDLSLFRVRSFAVANAGNFVFAVGFFGLLLCNVFFLTGVWHYSTLRAGVALTPGPLMAALAAPPRRPAFRPLRAACRRRSRRIAVRRRRAPPRAQDRSPPRVRHRVPAGEHARRIRGRARLRRLQQRRRRRATTEPLLDRQRDQQLHPPDRRRARRLEPDRRARHAVTRGRAPGLPPGLGFDRAHRCNRRPDRDSRSAVCAPATPRRARRPPPLR